MDTPENRGNNYENENQPIKVVKPDKYNGNRRGLEPWLLQLAIWFYDNGTTDDKGRRTVFITSFMRGRAAKWAQPYLKAFLEESRDSTGMFGDFTKFRK